MVAEVIQLYESVAQCPKCGCVYWFLHLDKLGHDYNKIICHECIECGFRVNIDNGGYEVAN